MCCLKGDLISMRCHRTALRFHGHHGAHQAAGDMAVVDSTCVPLPLRCKPIPHRGVRGHGSQFIEGTGNLRKPIAFTDYESFDATVSRCRQRAECWQTTAFALSRHEPVERLVEIPAPAAFSRSNHEHGHPYAVLHGVLSQAILGDGPRVSLAVSGSRSFTVVVPRLRTSSIHGGRGNELRVPCEHSRQTPFPVYALYRTIQ